MEQISEALEEHAVHHSTGVYRAPTMYKTYIRPHILGDAETVGSLKGLKNRRNQM